MCTLQWEEGFTHVERRTELLGPSKNGASLLFLHNLGEDQDKVRRGRKDLILGSPMLVPPQW
jgi:hypothetical protein